jgi:hypothetical protein
VQALVQSEAQVLERLLEAPLDVLVLELLLAEYWG